MSVSVARIVIPALAGTTLSIFGVAPASADTFFAGAARVDTTPPAFDAAADAAAFPLCPASAFDGPRPFALEEPYADLDGDARFTYGADLWCDANGNGRWDGIFISGGIDHQAQVVHDPIDVRAIAIASGGHALVVESVVAQGLFINVIDRIRDRARVLRPGIDEVIVSANHNESSPDTIGIYGAPNLGDAAGGRSGIDDYYVAYLVEQCAQAAAQAFDALQPATLYAAQAGVPPSVQIRLSHNFPTTDDDRNPAAVDFKLRVLQARDADGLPIFTVMNLAAHNQEIGHSGALATELSSDWPGYFHSALEARLAGQAMFLVADNGSLEDPETVPPVSTDTSPECDDGCYAQAQATGAALADAVVATLVAAAPLAPGAITTARTEFYVPIENNLFVAAAKAGLFGDRPTYIGGVDVGTLGTDLKTAVSVAGAGPDLQFITAPGEAFPALMIGSPWGIEDAGCPERANPPVPLWHAHARWRFIAGLGQDMIGYMIPAWGYSSEQGTYVTTCNNDGDNKDPAGHQHKLEDEGVGPVASNAVAEQLTALLAPTKDPLATIRSGRFVHADGSVDRHADGAVAIWLADPDATTLAADSGTLVALDDVGFFGDRSVAAHGRFIDFDSEPTAAPGIHTRGMDVRDAGGAVTKRWYVDLYPALTVTPLGAARAPDPGGTTGGTTTGTTGGTTTGTTTGTTGAASGGGGGGPMDALSLLVIAMLLLTRRAPVAEPKP